MAYPERTKEWEPDPEKSENIFISGGINNAIPAHMAANNGQFPPADELGEWDGEVGGKLEEGDDLGVGFQAVGDEPLLDV